MGKSARIDLAELIGTPYAVATEDAEELYKELVRRLSGHEDVVLSLAGIELFATSFANPAIAFLYKDFAPATIDAKLKFEGAFPEDLEKIERAKERGKEFFANPQLYESLIESTVHA